MSDDTKRCNSKRKNTQCVLMFGHDEEGHHGWDANGALVEWDNRCDSTISLSGVVYRCDRPTNHYSCVGIKSYHNAWVRADDQKYGNQIELQWGFV